MNNRPSRVRPGAATGTTRLTAEQQDWYLERFGVRYSHVQWQPGVPNRKTRRLAQRRRALDAGAWPTDGPELD